MATVPGTLAFQPNASATLFKPTQFTVSAPVSLNGSNGYTPMMAGVPVFWLDGADSTSTQLTSGRVTTWLDKSGNGRNATQATTSNAPTLATGAVNGLNALTFSGTTGVSGNCLVIPNFTTVPYTMFMVCKFDTTTSAGGFALNIQATGTGANPTWRNSIGTGAYQTQAIGVDYGGALYRYAGLDSGGAALNDTNFNLYNFQLPASATGTLFMNGNPGCNIDGFTMASNILYATPTIGAYNAQPTTGPMNGTICEIVWYNSNLPTADRQKMEGYLAWKWGIQGQLPSSHPYKTINLYAQPQLNAAIAGSYPIPLGVTLKTWKPSSAIPNLLLWYDAADTATITGTSQVTQWTNKGSVTATITNNTGSASSGNSGPYGLNYIAIPTTADLKFTVDLTSTGDRTWIIVSQNTSQLGTTVAANIMQWIGPLTPQGDEVGLARSSPDGLSYAFNQGPNGDSGGNYYTTAITNPLNVLAVYTVVRSTNSNNQIMTQTGTALTNNTNNPAGNFATGSITYLVNVANTSRGAYNLYEVMFLPRAVSVFERQQLEGYLAWKWGIQNSLPSSHLYKQFPPSPV